MKAILTSWRMKLRRKKKIEFTQYKVQKKLKRGLLNEPCDMKALEGNEDFKDNVKRKIES